MKKLEAIASKVYEEINEKSVTVYFNADLNDIAPFMCSPFNEGRFWLNNTKDLVNYIFEIIIANYLINDVMAFGDFNNIDKELSYFNFVQLLIAIEKCTPGAGIDFEFESFSSPLETRHSRNLNVDKFDFKTNDF